MAEKLTKDTPAERDHLTDSDYRDAILSVNRTKREASEHNGEAAKLTKDFCDRFNLDKQAFTTVAKLAREEDQHAALGFIRDFLIGCRRVGLFAQIDAFDDLIPAMAAIVEEARSGADMTRHGASLKVVDKKPEETTEAAE